MLSVGRNIVQTVSTPFAVLDIHFVPPGHSPSLFGVASSTGSIGLYSLAASHSQVLDSHARQPATPEVVHVHTIDVSDPGILVTAFTWHSRATGPDDSSLFACVSLSNGTIAMEEIPTVSANADRTSESLGCHDLEAWTVALAHDGMGIYSGGDDSVFAFWNLVKHSGRLWPDTLSLDVSEKLEWKDRKTHGAGVTAILPLKTVASDSLVLTGSYDDHIRLTSTSTMGRRRVLAESNLGGGVWRLKQLNETGELSLLPDKDQDQVLILASCMHAGARVLRLSCEGGEWQFKLLAKFEEHKSMNYGSDCQPSMNGNGQRTFITTSFYDRLLCLWRY